MGVSECVCLCVEADSRQSPAALVPLGGRDEVRRQLRRQVVAVGLDSYEMHGERELLLVQEAVLVDVRQLPDLPEHVVR